MSRGQVAAAARLDVLRIVEMAGRRRVRAFFRLGLLRDHRFVHAAVTLLTDVAVAVGAYFVAVFGRLFVGGVGLVGGVGIGFSPLVVGAGGGVGCGRGSWCGDDEHRVFPGGRFDRSMQLASRCEPTLAMELGQAIWASLSARLGRTPRNCAAVAKVAGRGHDAWRLQRLLSRCRAVGCRSGDAGDLRGN